ncbi:hypothetical protein ACFPYJ_19260 [Paenibacillus solisilvae]|uniref:Uncharacterized protein n=1 Tax=Paenibacillus solisilvae TaxID=2486751 RepID=A0ABW0W499_9BACL
MGVMLATDLATLSSKVQEGLAQLFTANLEWLERVLGQGRLGVKKVDNMTVSIKGNIWDVTKTHRLE